MHTLGVVVKMQVFGLYDINFEKKKDPETESKIFF